MPRTCTRCQGEEPRLAHAWGHLPELPENWVWKERTRDGGSRHLQPRAEPGVQQEGQPGKASARASSHSFIHQALRVHGSHCQRRRAAGRAAALVFLQGPRCPSSAPGDGEGNDSRRSAWRLEEVLQVRLPQPLLPLLVLGKLPQHGHHLVLKHGWRRLRFCGENKKGPREESGPTQSQHAQHTKPSSRSPVRCHLGGRAYLWPSNKCPSRCWAR